MARRLDPASAVLAIALVACVFVPAAWAQNPSPANVAAPRPVPKFKAVDVDNHTVLINRPGTVTLLIGTGEDSQEAARAAGKTMYPLQGRSDFQLVVVVDLRDSIAAWVQSVATSQMRANLDKEAIAIKPYFEKNGNKGDPRSSSHVIADFKGTICPQLGWKEGSDSLRGILFGGDGREIKRWDKIDDMDALQVDVRAAISAYDDALAKAAVLASKTKGTKLVQPPKPPPPLPPLTPASKPE